MKDRILPYNKNEMLLGLFVDESVSIVKRVYENSSASYEKNDICDLINIKTYLVEDNTLEYIEQKTNLKKVEILKTINKVIDNWLKRNLGKILEKNEYWVEDSLWREMNSRAKKLTEISKKDFRNSLFQKKVNLSTCLKYKNVVNFFDDEITEYLLQNTEECIDVLLEKYEKKIDVFRSKEIYISTKFRPTSEGGTINISSTVSKFIDETRADDYSKIEKMRLLSNSRNMELKTELKFLAKKKYEELNNNYFKEHVGFRYTFGIASSPHIEYKEFDEKERVIVFSEKWVKEHADFKIRFIFNTSTFLELMHRGRMSLDSLINPSSLTDILFTKGRDEYPIDNFTSMLQMNVLSLMIYEKMLAANEETVESLLAKFYNSYIVEEFGYDSFDYVYNNDEMSYRSKALLLLPVFDYTLRKIEYFLEHKSLNIEYLDFDDNIVNYRTIKSAQKIKNVYLNPNNKNFPFVYLHYQPNHLYINKESLSVFDAVKQGKVRYLELENHDKKTIDAFIEMDCLKLNENGIVIFTDYSRAVIYKALHFDGEIVYYDYDENIRKIIDDDIDSGLLIFDNNFLSMRESDRYSYIMDIQLYSNSLNMRNRYSHKGAVKFNDSEMQHQQNYFTILMLFIQVTLKFNIELCLIYDLENDDN